MQFFDLIQAFNWLLKPFQVQSSTVQFLLNFKLIQSWLELTSYFTLKSDFFNQLNFHLLILKVDVFECTSARFP